MLLTIHPFCAAQDVILPFLMLLRFTCSATESNLGPTRGNSLSECHSNLNSMTTHYFKKINLLEANNTINKFGVIYLLESYFYSSTAANNNYVQGCKEH